MLSTAEAQALTLFKKLMRDPNKCTKRSVTQKGRLNTSPIVSVLHKEKTVNEKSKISNTSAAGTSSKRRKTIIVRGLVSHVN